MVVFLFIGSGDVQPWALKPPAKPVVPEEAPLSSII
jgi:hypothetical protein